MHCVLLFILAFVALTTAVPHAVHGRIGVRRAQSWPPDLHSSSYDGSCGSWSGRTCRPGDCCGADGWCGNAAQHCGAGCQSGFGKCDAASSPDTGPSAYRSTAVTSASHETAQRTSSSHTSSTLSQPLGEPSTSVSMSSTPGSPSAAPSGTAPGSTASTPDSSSAAPTDTISVPTTSTLGSPTAAPIDKTYKPTTPITSSSYDAPTHTLTPSSPIDTTILGSPSAAPTDTTPVSSPALPSAAPTDITSATSSHGTAPPATPSGANAHGQGGPYIQPYRGDGGAGWPDRSQWPPLETLWTLNLPNLKKSCSNLGYGADNSEQELAAMKSSIQKISGECGVDASFALAIMMQESGGCIRVKSTANANSNPGLFQSHAGTGSCADADPCPEAQIHQMVHDGMCGTDSGPGLGQLLEGGTGAQKYYQAARIYNSGSLSSDGDLAHGGATPCYCSDIANKLIGWSEGPSTCQSGAVAA